MNWFALTAPLWIVGAPRALQPIAAQQPPTRGLVRVQPPADDIEFDRDAWREKLAHADLDAREKAFERVVELGTRGKAARESLERWAKDTDQKELAWTARMALRAIERRSETEALFAPGHWNDLQSRFDQLHKRFEELGPMLDGLHGGLPGPSFSYRAPAPGAESTHESFSLHIGPDGVTCETHANVDGEDKKRTYKADSLDELLEAHPELRGKIATGGGLGGAFQWRSDPWNGLRGWQGQGTPDARDLNPTPGSPPTHYLGIECTKPAPEKLKSLGLEPELGLAVERALPGTIADILGVRRGDILVELNGTPLYSSQDVGNVLRRRAADASIDVVLIDKKGQRRTLTWKPTEKSESDSSEERDG